VVRRIDGLLQGDHAGLFPGHGTERGEARPYLAGDDPRHIDWAVTARTSVPHVRDTVADHELELWLVLDASASLGFGTARATKFELAWSALGALGLLATRGGNRVGAVTASTPRRIVAARSGRAHVGSLLAGLHEPPKAGDAATLAAALESCRRAARHRGMVAVASDFLGADAWERPLAALALRHDVLAVQVVDPTEQRLPDAGLLAVEDPETGRRRLVDTRDAGIRRRYAEAAAARQAAIARRITRAGADHLVLSTERDWVVDLVSFVAGRKARLLAAGGARR